MIDRLEMTAIATKFGLGLNEHANGTYMLVFPEIKGLTPILITADNGATWTPEASNGKISIWGGEICLIGTRLVQEIEWMYRVVPLIDTEAKAKLIEVAKYLSEINLGKVYH